MNPGGMVVRLHIRPLLSITVVSLLMTSLLLASTSVVRGPDTTSPEVVTSFPPDQGTNVSLYAPIYLNFSEPIDPSSFTITIQPAVAFGTPSFSGTDSNVVIPHGIPFSLATRYVATANAKDKAGNWLDGDGNGISGDPFTWAFSTGCKGVCIVKTDPADGDINVPLDKTIIVTFSDVVNITPITITITPSHVFSLTWTNGNTVLSMDHVVPFRQCTVYTIAVDSPSLVPGPVPSTWSFTTAGCSPMIMHIEPPEANAPIDSAIIVNFSAEMDLDTVVWALNHTLILGVLWSDDNRTLILTHTEKFHPCSAYGISISGKDKVGRSLVPGPVPNPYNFTTVCTYPKVTLTSPFRRQNNVFLDATILATFSESMENDSVEDSFSYIDDRMTIFTKADGIFQWSSDNIGFAFSPSVPFRSNVTYTVKLDASLARGLGKNYLDGNANGVIDYPRNADDYTWQFSTAVANDNMPPYVQSVYPDHDTTEVVRDVIVSIVFSETMNRLSVEKAIDISNDNDRFARNFSWPNNRTVNFRILPLMPYGAPYTIGVKASASDLVGNHMTEAYTWSFTTIYWRGDVYGKVVDAVDGTPIADANVELLGIQTITDSQGNFTLRNVRQGIYMLNASKQGYEMNHSLVGVASDTRDLGVIRLRRIAVQPQSDVGAILIIAAIVIALVFLVLLMLVVKRRRKPLPTKFEQWRGEVAEIETGETER